MQAQISTKLAPTTTTNSIEQRLQKFLSQEKTEEVELPYQYSSSEDLVGLKRIYERNLAIIVDQMESTAYHNLSLYLINQYLHNREQLEIINTLLSQQ